MKFVKRPIEIDAIRFTGDNWDEVGKFFGASRWWQPSTRNLVDETRTGTRTLCIPTLEGEMIAQPGDWIIKGIQGEFYPCKHSIFEATYVRAGEVTE